MPLRRIFLDSKLLFLSADSILKALNALIVSVNEMHRVIEQQTGVINGLRQLIEECELCKQRPPQILLPTCETHPPRCFHGVTCHNTADGPRCGACPRGYTGDGISCHRVITCDDRPCFHGVQCVNTADGYQCGSCPPGYEGNGEQCRRRSGCDYNACHPGK